MSGNEAIEVEGRVVEVLPSAAFRVELPNGHRIVARVSGQMRLNLVRLALGDTVTVQMSPYDLSKGCIAFREKQLRP